MLSSPSRKQGKGALPLSPAPQSPNQAFAPLRTLSVDDGEHFLHNHHASVASLRLLFTFTPECRSPSLRNRCSPSPEYPPACYQRGFTDAEGKVWTRFDDGTFKHLPPKNVGLKNDLYIFKENGVETDKVEIFFDQHVERDYARLSRRIKEESNKFSQMSGDEAGTIMRFVASQAVRTMGHKETMSKQANGATIDTRTFVQVMVRHMMTLHKTWKENLPTIRFFTPLPNIGEKYITGDHPVAIVVFNDNEIWGPTSRPVQGITNIGSILKSPHAFMVALSPYICVSIEGGGSGKVHLPKTVDLMHVRWFNDLIRNQCKIFTLARDRDSLN